jgi:hypothetical protein
VKKEKEKEKDYKKKRECSIGWWSVVYRGTNSPSHFLWCGRRRKGGVLEMTKEIIERRKTKENTKTTQRLWCRPPFPGRLLSCCL